MIYDLGELPGMRDQTVTLVKEAVRRKVRAYVLVNNRWEGNAPLLCRRWWMLYKAAPKVSSVRDALLYKKDATLI